MPGYIPVYIRPGDTPLEDINLELAEAFKSYARKHNRIIYGRSKNEVVEPSFKTELEDLSLEENNKVVNNADKIEVKVVQHIQKIPRP